MIKITASRYHDFCAGHRVVGHEGKCANLHGHNYRVHFNIVGVEEKQDAVGRVLDFSVIKNTLCQWLKDNWDHKMLLWQEDPLLGSLQAIDPTTIKTPFNPTAENMAKYLVETVAPVLLAQADVTAYLESVTIEETRKCSVTYTNNELEK